MTTYKITIKDNSIPEHMLHEGAMTTEYTAIIKSNTAFERHYLKEFNIDILYLNSEIKEYIKTMAQELDTDEDSIEVLSIIKQ